jgi:nitrous oxidase accessory protein NosD
MEIEKPKFQSMFDFKWTLSYSFHNNRIVGREAIGVNFICASNKNVLNRNGFLENNEFVLLTMKSNV